MAVATRISPAAIKEALDAFCLTFPEALGVLVEVRVVVDPYLAIRVALAPGAEFEFPETLPGHEEWGIVPFESDARIEFLTGNAA